MAKEYTYLFPFQGPPKFNQIWIFGLKIYHLATLVPGQADWLLEPSLRHLKLQLQRQRCSRLERFSKSKKRFSHKATTRGVVDIYIAGVVTHER
jgi:hypothetical protein